MLVHLARGFFFNVGRFDLWPRKIEPAFPLPLLLVFETCRVVIFGMNLPFGCYCIAIPMQCIHITLISLKVLGRWNGHLIRSVITLTWINTFRDDRVEIMNHLMGKLRVVERKISTLKSPTSYLIRGMAALHTATVDDLTFSDVWLFCGVAICQDST